MPPADASLKRVSALIAQAAALGVHQNRLDQAKQACIDRDAAATAALQAAVHAEPFSRDIFRLRCMDASRLGLSTQTAQGTVLIQCVTSGAMPEHETHDLPKRDVLTCVRLERLLLESC